MLVAIILAVIAAIVVPVELLRRPFRSAFAWMRKWLHLIGQLSRLDQAVERLAAARAHEYAKGYDWQSQDWYDYFTGRRKDAEGIVTPPPERRAPR